MIYATVVIIVELAQKPYLAPTCGLVLSNVLQLLVFLQWTVRMAGEVREKLTSIRQVTYYGSAVKLEAPPIIDNHRPPKDWPSEGNISFKNVVLKYHESGVSVLKNVSINIKSKEKIGIVGRTGSGKSTLLIALLRIVELTEGEIVIDDFDSAKFGLKDLRSRIAVIPQEPILFVGTIRENIDLFSKNTDEEIWKALDSVHLGKFIRKLDLKLDSLVIGEANFNSKSFFLAIFLNFYVTYRKRQKLQRRPASALLYCPSHSHQHTNPCSRRSDSCSGPPNRQAY
jgi:ABC-type multidrug transport system fused ATPase/permease subunit